MNGDKNMEIVKAGTPDSAPADFSVVAESFPGYSVRTEGGLSFIVDPDGRVVSRGYHELRIFRVGNVSALFGRLGAMMRLLRPAGPGEPFQESDDEFHDLRLDAGLGLLLSRIGAMEYIVDPRSGKNISKGYHEFLWENGKLLGKTGATVEPVKLPVSVRIGPGNQLLME